MEPRKKSKALIITFIITLIILIGGYLLISKSGVLKGDKSILGKEFTPLFGTSKQKDVIVSDVKDKDTTTKPDDTPTQNPITQSPDETPVTTPEIKKPVAYTPPIKSLPKPVISTSTYNKQNTQINIPATPDVPIAPPIAIKTNQCVPEEIPLVFTDEEQQKLRELTRQFYRLAPQIKTADDIKAELEAGEGYKNIIANAEELTKQCYEQTTGRLASGSLKAIPQGTIGAKMLATYYTNYIPEYEQTAGGQILSTNYSQINGARIDRKANPWHNNTTEQYYFTAKILERSPRIAVVGQIEATPPTPAEGWDDQGFDDSVQAEEWCKIRGLSQVTAIRKVYPAGYSIDYSCGIIDGPILSTETANNNKGGTYRGIYRGIAWYPTTSSKAYIIAQKPVAEYFFDPNACKKRAGDVGCYQPFLHEKDPTGKETKIKLPRVEWVYGINVRSSNFSNYSECETAAKKLGASCSGNSTANESAYVNKIWNTGVVESEADGTMGYIAPIDYHIFENIFNIW